MPTISVVMPAHNEQYRIKECLDALAMQTSLPMEVIVVDNNSTDKTIAIAKKYSNVKILSEPRQGQLYSRNTGFDAAKGDIIVRIDADTICPPKYIEHIQNVFSKNQNIAISGYGISDFEVIPHTSRLVSWCYFTYVQAYFGHPTLWGANLAFPRKFWPIIKPLILYDAYKYNEDQDMSLALASIGVKAVLDKDMTVTVSMEGAQHLSKYHNYVRMMRNLKKDDLAHPRTKLPSRLPKTTTTKRFIMWLVSAWSIYVFYFLAAIYSTFVWLIKFTGLK